MIKHVPSLEFMSYQDDGFGIELAKHVNWLRIDGTYSTEAVAKSGIAEIIGKRFKMNITLVVLKGNRPNASISIPPISKEHPLTQIFEKSSNYIGRLLTEVGVGGQNIGTIDLKHGQCGGLFSKLPSTIYLTTALLSDFRYTPEEIAAFILHEVGHAFTYYYYLLNVTMGSFVTSAIAAMVAGAKRDDERKVIIAKGAKILGIDNVSIEPLLHNPADQNASLLQALYIRDTSNIIRSETGFSIYESKSAEQLADLFAVKLGMARHLASGMGKLTTNTGSISTAYNYVTRAVLDVTITIGKIASLGLINSKIQSKLLMYPSDIVSAYDSPDNRIKLIRQHVIQELKEADPSNIDFLKRLLSDLDDISNSQDKYPYQERIASYLQRKHIRFFRDQKKTQDLQKDVEDLIFNEMFVQAAKFQTGAKS